MADNSRTKTRKTKFIQVYLREVEFDALSALADEAGLSKTEYMRQLLLAQSGDFRTSDTPTDGNRFTEIAA